MRKRRLTAAVLAAAFLVFLLSACSQADAGSGGSSAGIGAGSSGGSSVSASTGVGKPSGSAAGGSGTSSGSGASASSGSGGPSGSTVSGSSSAPVYSGVSGDDSSCWVSNETVLLKEYEYAFAGDSSRYAGEWESHVLVDSPPAETAGVKVQMTEFETRPESEAGEDNFHVRIRFTVQNRSDETKVFSSEAMTVNGVPAVDGGLLVEPVEQLNSDSSCSIEPGRSGEFTAEAFAFACDRNDLFVVYTVGLTLRVMAESEMEKDSPAFSLVTVSEDVSYGGAPESAESSSGSTAPQMAVDSRHSGQGTPVFDSGTGVKISMLGYAVPEDSDVGENPAVLFLAENSSDEFYQVDSSNSISGAAATRSLPAHSSAVCIGEVSGEAAAGGTPGVCEIDIFSADTGYDFPAAWQLSIHAQIDR